MLNQIFLFLGPFEILKCLLKESESLGNKMDDRICVQRGDKCANEKKNKYIF